jgi:BMFP domain-containing protein YqiC
VVQNSQHKKLEPDLPVYHARFKDVVDKFRVLLKDFQHSIDIVQREDNGVTAEVKVTITLKK